MSMDTYAIGESGLKQYSGYVYEEQLKALQGDRAVKVYDEMRNNDPVIGAILFCIEMLCRRVKWDVEAASEEKPDQEAKQFLLENIDDMSHTWESLISEVLTMLPFGWSYFEIVYKIRGGKSKDPSRNSKYSDGKYGFRKIALRSQNSRLKWDFDDDGGIRGMWQQTIKGSQVFIPIEKALLFRTKEEKNNPEGKSVLRCCYRPWYFLKKIQEFEAIGIERDLAGLPVMEVPPEVLDPEANAENKALLATCQKVVSETRRNEREGLLIPCEEIAGENGNEKTGFKFRLMSSGGSRQVDPDKVITRYEQRIAMSVLAEFILLGMDKVGSFSLASSKMNLFAAAISAWLDSIASVFNRFAVPRLFEANNWSLEKLPKLIHGPVQEISLEELGNFLKNAGIMAVSETKLENYVRSRAGLPLKEDDANAPM